MGGGEGEGEARFYKKEITNRLLKNVKRRPGC
jgi:hypothetical protein